MSDEERVAQMTDAEFEAWASEIKLTNAQWMPVRYVVDREYDRGRAAMGPQLTVEEKRILGIGLDLIGGDSEASKSLRAKLSLIAKS